MRFRRNGLSFRLLRGLIFCALLVSSRELYAAPTVDVLATPLEPLIDAAAPFPTRFAVDVPHAVSPSTHGEWSTAGARSTWRYSAQIPTAISISFHASRVAFPPNAVLTVSAAGATYLYTAKDVHRGEIWSRIGRGDALSFELTLDTADVGQLRFEIASLQAGYRSLGAGVPNNRHYNALAAKSESVGAAAATVQSCQENWACHITPTNTGPGQSSVVLVIGNVGWCSGTLINDVRGDGIPYVLTARHCENGNPDGGAPDAARSLGVYWDATVPCGNPLGTFYDSSAQAQFGATTVVEQQDAWLIRLNDAPVVDDAYYAGWDATGATFVGGFTAHYGLGTSRQFVGWFGQAAYSVVPGSELGVHFESTVWATVNAVGSSAGGASGSGLFDETGHLTGVHIRGVRQPGSDAGVCPSPSPAVPSLQSSTGLSTALSGIFGSTADPKSTTGATTLQSVLDPDNTGRKVLDGQTSPPLVTLTDNAFGNYFTGQSITLSWTSRRAQSCAASGGESGDGWSGSLVKNGSLQLTSLDGGTVTYTITCSDGTGRTATASRQIVWSLSSPTIFFGPLNGSLAFYNVPFQMFWRANLRPCTASGGIAGDGWSGSVQPNGTTSLAESTLGDITYSLTCGTGARATTVSTTMRVFPPSATLVADAGTLRVGELLHLTTTSQGLPCTLAGGAAGDGWAGNNTYNGTVTLTESAPGTYTYTFSCGNGAQVATSQASVAFVAASTPPHVSLTASATSVPEFSEVTFAWDSNVGPCLFSRTGPASGTRDSWPKSPLAQLKIQEEALGEYTYTVACGAGPTAVQDTVVVTYTGTPRLSVFQGPTGAIAGQQFLMQYQSNLAPCTFTGGGAGDGWAGTSPERNANRPVVESAGGTYTFVATCGFGSVMLTRQAVVNVLSEPPRVTVTADRNQQVWGQPVTLSWTSNSSPCQRTGGVQGDGWAGTADSSGSTTVTATGQLGGITYGVHCGVNPLSASGFVSVSYLPIAAPTLSVNPTTVVVGEDFTLTWASSDGSTCTANGGAWSGDRPATGNLTLREPSVGTYPFFLSCGLSVQARVDVSVTAPAPVPPPPPPATVQLTINITTVTAGNPVTLTWTTANVDTCTAAGGSAGDGWSGSVAAAGGSKQIQEGSAGTYNYSLTCTGAGGITSATATASVVVNAPVVVVSSPPPSSSGGGGGALGTRDLAILCMMLALCCDRRRRV